MTNAEVVSVMTHEACDMTDPGLVSVIAKRDLSGLSCLWLDDWEALGYP